VKGLLQKDNEERICKKNQVIGDMREKNTDVVLYLEGYGFRRIARILSEIFGKKIHNLLVLYWIRKKGL
jgi:hypothetical protein